MTIDPQKKKNMNKHEFPFLIGYLFLLLCETIIWSWKIRIEEFHLDKTHGTLLVQSASGVGCISQPAIFLDEYETVNKNPRSFKKSITNMVTDLTHKNPSTNNHQTIGKWSQHFQPTNPTGWILPSYQTSASEM